MNCLQCKTKFNDGFGNCLPYYRIQRPYQLKGDEIIYLCQSCYEDREIASDAAYAANREIEDLEAKLKAMNAKMWLLEREIKKRDVEKYTKLLRELLDLLDEDNLEKGILLDHMPKYLKNQLRELLYANQ